MSQEKATIIIGRSGATDSLKEEIKSQLKKKKVVKISLPKEIDDRDGFSGGLCDELGAELLDVRGRKIIIYRD